MSQVPRIVVGYHGCLEPLASRLFNNEMSIDDWKVSENVWAWLGHGIYFWEGSHRRAYRWAVDKARVKGGKPTVVGALIDLGRCFDLTDEQFAEFLARTFERVKREYTDQGMNLPANRGGSDSLRRELDCLIINAAMLGTPPGTFSSVRAPFLEGPPAYPGAMIRGHTHVQSAVRDRSCILSVFRPNSFR